MLPSQLDDYVLTLRRLREKYADKLHIRIGLEAEYFPAYLGWLREETERLDIEYLILGCHYDTTDEQDARASRFGGSPPPPTADGMPNRWWKRWKRDFTGIWPTPTSFEPGDGLRRRRRESLPGHLCRSGAAGHPPRVQHGRSDPAGPSRRLFRLHPGRVLAHRGGVPRQGHRGLRRPRPSELDVVPAIEEKKAFLHSLGIPVLDTLPGLE